MNFDGNMPLSAHEAWKMSKYKIVEVNGLWRAAYKVRWWPFWQYLQKADPLCGFCTREFATSDMALRALQERETQYRLSAQHRALIEMIRREVESKLAGDVGMTDALLPWARCRQLLSYIDKFAPPEGK